MKTNSWKKLSAIMFAALTLFSFSACDNDDTMGKGDVDFEITDAPSDDASIKGVFVTIAEVKIDGKPVSGFTKQTIDLKAYQEGNTKLLVGAKQLDAKSYSNLTLVMDANTDASGNSPGCYVQTTDNTKYKLRSAASGTFDVAVNKTWTVASNTKSTVVLDFELRKALKHSSDPSIRYDFVSDAELSSAIRVVNKERAGTINGSYQESAGGSADMIIVYAYRKGTFNQSTETSAQGDGQVMFANAAGSAEVKQGLSGKTFKLALLEEGEYELHFARHKKDANGRMIFQAMLDSETSVDGSVAGIINLKAGATVSVSAVIDIL